MYPSGYQHPTSIYHPGSGHRVPREPRLPYLGQVRLLVPFDPWRLMLTMEGATLSVSGVCAIWQPAAKAPQPSAERGPAPGPPPMPPRPGLSRPQTGADIAELFIEGDPYDLQLEHDAPHLPAPFLRARLVRRERTPRGWAFGFAFEAPDSDLLGLVHELSRRADRGPDGE